MTNILQKTFEQAARRISEAHEPILDDFTTEYKRMDAITILLLTERTHNGPLVVTGQALIKPPGWTDRDKALLIDILTEQVFRMSGYGPEFDGHGQVQFESKRKHDDWKD